MSKELALKSINIDGDIWDMNLDYADRNNVTSLFMSEGNIHPYPAKAVPDMVRDLLSKIKDLYGVKNVLDPFVGSGTVALESKLLGLDFYGSDLNPLAVLLARTKSLTIEGTPYVKEQLENFASSINEKSMKEVLFGIANFKNIDYWFKEKNIEQLSYIKHCIGKFLREAPLNYREVFSLIILTAFSATIRESSLTRNEEFKLYRLSPADIENFNVNTIGVFSRRIKELLEMVQDVNAAFNSNAKSEIYLSNAKNINYLGHTKVDLILTSPPYGDSQSTVAYGQFSRLSLQWMSDLMKNYLGIDTLYENCDEYLLGGKYSISVDLEESTNKILDSSNTLRKLISDIDELTKAELKTLELARITLIEFLDNLKNSKDNINNKIIFTNDMLSSLIKEKIRLHIFRKINSNIKLEKKKIKSLTTSETSKFLSDLMNENSKRYKRRFATFSSLLPNVLEAINRRIKLLPKRGKEILDFFIDLNKAVEESNKVLSDEGIQVWIVGHRTVLGKLNVNLANILLEWFESISYNKIALIKRTCHFKRLPRRINSTVTRNKGIETMVEEYVLIVQKNYSATK